MIHVGAGFPCLVWNNDLNLEQKLPLDLYFSGLTAVILQLIKMSVLLVQKYSLKHNQLWPVQTPQGILGNVALEVSCHLKEQCHPEATTDMAIKGKYSTGAHLRNFTHPHMASDAPQPQITGLQKHHATLSTNTSQLQAPFLFHKLYTTCSKMVLRVSGVRGGTSVLCTRKESKPFQMQVCGLLCLGFLDVQGQKFNRRGDTEGRHVTQRIRPSPVQSAAVTHRRHPAVNSKSPNSRVTHFDPCRTLTNHGV